jgi:sugar fermentation stimulation protein A
LRFVEHPQSGQLVSLDTQLPNKLFEVELRNGRFAQFCSSRTIQREVASVLSSARTRSRYDFLLTSSADIRCWVEVKSVSLIEDRVALFPDARTERGTRHLQELTALKKNGDRAAVVFLVQRPDADRLRAHQGQDPVFAAALTDAQSAGVEIYAYTCCVTLEEVRIKREIPVG